jgi:hypothetical protein
MENSREPHQDETFSRIKERKVFWIVVAVLGLLDMFLPVWLALAAAIPIVVAAWWVAYQSDWLRRRLASGKISSNSRAARNQHAA